MDEADRLPCRRFYRSQSREQLAKGSYDSRARRIEDETIFLWTCFAVDRLMGLEHNRHITCGVVAETANNIDLALVHLGKDG